MEKLIALFFALPFFLAGSVSCSSKETSGKNKSIPEKITLTKTQLLDKIKGGWAGQTIGCTYGGPTEFKYQGTMIQDYIPINWSDGCIKWYYDNTPGLYDDVYMDLTFMEVFDRLGIDAPPDSLAIDFSKRGYLLWHANQAARYNIQQGIMPPESGHWLNNPHADDIDFQIEADFAGLMSPGMVNTASDYADKAGHIMNYGDGWYGGVYVAAMYSLAFISDDMEFIVNEALKTIPKESKYHQCMADVIKWHKMYPDDWKITWFECEKKWSSDIGCPHGVFLPLNIDAVINSAYILIGLLYGEGDFYKTMDISTRCGQDSDCNPASAAGILGTMIGYSNIPEYWMPNLHEVEDINFLHTTTSLNKTYVMGLDQALKVIVRDGGKIDGENVTIQCQQPKAVRFEEAFAGHFPIELRQLDPGDGRAGGTHLNRLGTIEFNGTGIVVNGGIHCGDETYVARVEAYLDGKLIETFNMPAAYNARRHEIFWKYRLPEGKHELTFKWLNPRNDANINAGSVLVYSGAPVVNHHQH